MRDEGKIKIQCLALQICQTYSNVLESYQNQLILGVMGVDVSLEDIKKLTPRFTVSCLCWWFLQCTIYV